MPDPSEYLRMTTRASRAHRAGAVFTVVRPESGSVVTVVCPGCGAALGAVLTVVRPVSGSLVIVVRAG
jgi:hypothetical protein